jgi:hypothetical protein
MIIESKVLVPAVAGFIAAALALAAAFGLDLSQDQQTAILGVSTAAVVLLQTVLGYLAPHTARPDLVEVPAEARHAHGEAGYTLVEVALFVFILTVAVILAVRYL